MTTRPNYIDVRSQSQASTTSSSSRALRSPRLHVAGDVPPELSPLDAFALQSRLLAKQLEESASTGRRVSRLPPLTATSPVIAQGRSDYFRSRSQDSASVLAESPESPAFSASSSAGLGVRTEVEDAFGDQRPVSVHPRMSRIPPTPVDTEPIPPLPTDDVFRGRNPSREDGLGAFGLRREESPVPLEPSTAPPPRPSQSPSRLDASSQNQAHRSPGRPPKSASSLDSFALAPPRPMYHRSGSAMSSPSLEPTDEDAMSNSFHSLPPRKLSAGESPLSGSSRQMYSPSNMPQRSPSIASEASAPLPRPSFNFSRPLSRAGTPVTPCTESPSRQASADTQPSSLPADDLTRTPASTHSDSFDSYDDGKAAPSYIYSKFSLPRGKIVQRGSTIDAFSPPTSHRWEQPSAKGQGLPRDHPPTPPTRPTSSSGRGIPGDFSLKSTWMDQNPVGPAPQPSPNPSRPSTEEGRSSEDAPRGRPLTSPLHDNFRGPPALSINTSDSASTLKAARSQYSVTPSASELSAEEHLSLGIECHENGSLSESTYHLRHAARMNHPTAMLLFALACRHGWGMRPNQKEGVEWLRKAAECASLEIADDEDQAKEGKPVNFLEQKTRKAQFALSIYELGVSHMNGWGIDQDRALALRCFEIAGNWGDVDALAEAGFCYAQGVGCKKDLKKSAKFYRMAEAKGMSMVGNSWIHKSKYAEDTDDAKSMKKSRSKSRTRGLFSKKPKEPKEPKDSKISSLETA